jgi:hypothetical protein
MEKSKKLMILFWGQAILFDLIAHSSIPLPLDNYPYSVLTSICLSFTMFAWFMADAKEINLNPSYELKVAIVAFGYISLPYYLIRYKGWLRGLKAIAKFIVYVFAYFFVVVLFRRFIP